MNLVTDYWIVVTEYVETGLNTFKELLISEILLLFFKLFSIKPNVEKIYAVVRWTHGEI